MATQQRDSGGRYVLKLAIYHPLRRPKCETYRLKTHAGWEAAVADGQALSYYRASTLGRGVKITSAVVSERGPARKSRSVIDAPLPGMLGVNVGQRTGKAVNTNTLTTGLMFRFETSVGDFAVRKMIGIADGWVVKGQWSPGAPGQYGIFDLGDYKSSFVYVTADVLAMAEFDGTKRYSPAALAKFVTYEESWRRLVKAIYSLTNYFRPAYTPEGGDLVSAAEVNWSDVIYEGVTDATVKSIKGV